MEFLFEAKLSVWLKPDSAGYHERRYHTWQVCCTESEFPKSIFRRARLIYGAKITNIEFDDARVLELNKWALWRAVCNIEEMRNQ